ncbi:32555_t:CDS:2, partial [Racocetra persica]
MTVGKTYTVDPSIGTCTCIAALGGSPCKHQAAIAVKYHEGTVAKDSTFYASLYTPIMQENNQRTEKVIQNIDPDSNKDMPTADD